MENPLTLKQALAVSDYLAAYHQIFIFQHPEVIGDLEIEVICPAPYPSNSFEVFKENFNFMFGYEHSLKQYEGDQFKVIVIATLRVLNKVTEAQPFFYDLQALIDLGIDSFHFPESILEN